MKLVRMIVGIAVCGLILASIARWILPFTPLFLAGIVVVAAILTAFVIWNRSYDSYDPLYAVVIGGVLAYLIYGALIGDLYVYIPPGRGAPQGAPGSHLHLSGLAAWLWVLGALLMSVGLLAGKEGSEFLGLGDTTRKAVGLLLFLGSPVIVWVMYLWTH